jgi:hypothetical protein
VKKILFLILILTSAVKLYSQDVLSIEERFPELKYSELTGTIYYKPSGQIVGNAFLDDNYQIGRIFLKNGAVIENVKLNLDLYNNELIVYQETKHQLIIVDKYSVKGFELMRAGVTEKFLLIQDIKAKLPSKYGSYIRVLTEGKNSLYKLQYKEKVTLQNANNSYMYELVNRTEYHLFVGSEDEKIKLKRSTIKKLFPDHKTEVRKYIRQTGIKPKSESGFAKIIEFINTL